MSITKIKELTVIECVALAFAEWSHIALSSADPNDTISRSIQLENYPWQTPSLLPWWTSKISLKSL